MERHGNCDVKYSCWVQLVNLCDWLQWVNSVGYIRLHLKLFDWWHRDQPLVPWSTNSASRSTDNAHQLNALNTHSILASRVQLVMYCSVVAPCHVPQTLVAAIWHQHYVYMCTLKHRHVLCELKRLGLGWPCRGWGGVIWGRSQTGHEKQPNMQMHLPSNLEHTCI